jgi:hypothetical protein
MDEYKDLHDQGQVSNMEQFLALFEYATIGILLTDARGEIINFNHLLDDNSDIQRRTAW